MGLKTHNYHVDYINVTLPAAYAQLTHVSIDFNGYASAIFAIQQNREMILTNDAIEEKHIECLIDKEQPIYGQLYTKAKEELFDGWEDDIV